MTETHFHQRVQILNEQMADMAMRRITELNMEQRSLVQTLVAAETIRLNKLSKNEIIAYLRGTAIDLHKSSPVYAAHMEALADEYQQSIQTTGDPYDNPHA